MARMRTPDTVGGHKSCVGFCGSSIGCDDEAVVVEGEELEAEDLGQRHNHALKPYLNLRFLDGMLVCCAW